MNGTPSRFVGRSVDTGRVVEVHIRDGTITDAAATDSTAEEVPFIAPAFVDIQINGGLGRHFGSASLTVADVRTIVAECRRHGIARLCPTVITGDFESMRRGLATLANAVASDPDLDYALPAFHLEGPYISPEDGPRGAHPRAAVRPPDWDEFRRFQDAAEGRIRLVTLAPETDGALRFIERLNGVGVVVAIGHTAASPECIRDAVSAGAKLSTHLGNGCHPMLPRHQNYLWEQLADDRLWASLICDGHHLPAAVIRCFVRVKTPARLILTSDASSLAGMPPGRYREWQQEIDVLPEGKIVVAESGLLAGSWAFTDRCIGIAATASGIGLGDAIRMASTRPRQLLGLAGSETGLEPGDPADFILFDEPEPGQVRIRSTVVQGRVVAANAEGSTG